MAKMNDSLEKFDWEWKDVIGVQAAGRGKPPLLPQHPWTGILLRFDEDDGDGRQRWTIF